MTIIALPESVASTAGGFSVKQMTYEFEDVSDTTGASSSRILGPARWGLSMRGMDDMSPEQSDEWVSLMLRLRGTVNRLAAWDISRPVPLGTMRGTLELSAACSIGDNSLSISGGLGQAGTTLRTGDWLQIGTGMGTSQLIKVNQTATANGSGIITINLDPAMRYAFSIGTPVTWNKPVAYYKKQSPTSYDAVAGSLNYSGHSVDLLEQWS